MQAAAAGHRAGRADEPGAAQAGQRPPQPGRAARAPGRRGRRGRATASSRPGCWTSALDSLAELRARVRRRDLRGRRQPGRDQPARPTDIANMGLARAAGLPVIVVGDIDRGGVFAALLGTLALLDPADQALVAGFVINKFRGDARLLRAGPATCCAALTGRPMLGVLPWHDGPVAGRRGLAGAGRARGRRRRGRRRAPTCCGSPSSGCRGSATSPTSTRSRASPACWSGSPARRPSWPTPTWSCCPAPGPPSPTWPGCGSRGLADAVAARARRRQPVLGICGGYQMLGARDRRRGRVRRRARSPGSGCCRCGSRSAPTSGWAGPAGSAYGEPVRATRSTTAS